MSTPTPAPIPPPRSGDQVLNTTMIVGLFVSLLSPFLSAILTYVKTHTIIDFSDGYQMQLETVIGLAITYGIASLHMYRIRNRDVPTA